MINLMKRTRILAFCLITAALVLVGYYYFRAIFADYPRSVSELEAWPQGFEMRFPEEWIDDEEIKFLADRIANLDFEQSEKVSSRNPIHYTQELKKLIELIYSDRERIDSLFSSYFEGESSGLGGKALIDGSFHEASLALLRILSLNDSLDFDEIKSIGLSLKAWITIHKSISLAILEQDNSNCASQLISEYLCLLDRFELNDTFDISFLAKLEGSFFDVVSCFLSTKEIHERDVVLVLDYLNDLEGRVGLMESGIVNEYLDFARSVKNISGNRLLERFTKDSGAVSERLSIVLLKRNSTINKLGNYCRVSIELGLAGNLELLKQSELDYLKSFSPLSNSETMSIYNAVGEMLLAESSDLFYYSRWRTVWERDRKLVSLRAWVEQLTLEGLPAVSDH